MHEDQPERVPGPELGDFLGIPINDAARLRATAWDASLQTLREWQCRPHSADYIWRGPSQLKISKEVDPVSREIVAFHAEWLRSVDRPVYLDGRAHPSPNAPHTWGGFSTGRWEGDMLTVTVTHLKEGYLRRNGLPRSDKATVREHWIRNGDFLTVMTVDHGSRVPHRTVRPHHRLRADGQPAGAAVSVRRRAGDRSVRRTRCRTSSRAATRTWRSSRPSTRSRSKRRVAAPRRCIPSSAPRSASEAATRAHHRVGRALASLPRRSR